MNASLPFVLIILIVPLFLGGCKDKPIGGYVPASSFSKKGFAKDREVVLALRGKVLKVWGYVDGGNVFPKDWGTNQPGKWRFKLKAKPWDDVGQSFSINIPVDDRHDELVALFEATDFAEKPTRVFVTGKLSTFDAPMNFVRKTGLSMDLNSSKDVLLKAPTEMR